MINDYHLMSLKLMIAEWHEGDPTFWSIYNFLLQIHELDLSCQLSVLAV